MDQATTIDQEIMRRANRLRLFEYTSEGQKHPEQVRKMLWDAERALCKDDPWYWLTNYVWMANPHVLDEGYDEFPLIPWPKQQELVEFLLSGIDEGKRRLLNKSREIGATWFAMILVSHGLIFKKRFSALLLSRKEGVVDNRLPDSMFGKIRFILSHQPTEFVKRDENGRFIEYTDNFMKIENTVTKSYVVGESTAAGAGRSTRHTVVVGDEWAHVPKEQQNPIKLSLTSVARTWWKITTPNGRGEEFHTDWLTAPDDCKLFLNWRANPNRTEEWYEGLLKENGGHLTWDEREQEYNGSFKGVSGHRIVKYDENRNLYLRAQLDDKVRKNSAVLGVMDFGSGPSWTVCSFFLVQRSETDSRLLKIYLDRCLAWQRTPVNEIADEIVNTTTVYYNPRNAWFVGDPSGVNKDSRQESWESNLNANGVPIACLPVIYNDVNIITKTLQEVQECFDSGLLMLNIEDAGIAVEALESWEWDLPTGVPLHLVNKSDIKPKKDANSHPGDTVRYGVGYILREEFTSTSQEVQVLTRSTKIVPEAGQQAVEMLERDFDWGRILEQQLWE